MFKKHDFIYDNFLVIFSMNMQLFESFRRVDVYAFALVMWETTRRCMTHEGVEEYALPYYEMVSFVIFYLGFILRSFGKLKVILLLYGSLH